MDWRIVLSLMVALPLAVLAETYEIGEEMETAAFWSADPVLFVKRHAEAGFEFTSDAREGAASRQDGGVRWHGVPVYESRLSFGEAGGIERVELVLFATGGTETYQLLTDENGKNFRRRVRVEKTMTREDYRAVLKAVREKMSATGKSKAEKARTKDAAVRQFAETWQKSSVPTRTTLTWNYTQQGKDESTFRAGFIRLAVDGPARLGTGAAKKPGVERADAKGAKKITDNVIRDPRGDVFIDNVPMVDQGQKGYCAVASAERVLRYYGVDVDEHELAESAGTRAEGGTPILGMKQSVEAVGRRYKLATVVCYGDFEKSAEARIAGICDEVKAYNKAAKKLKKPAITDDMFIYHQGNTTYYSYSKVDAAMDAEVLKEMKVNGMQKSKYTKFVKDIREQVARGIPLFWSVKLGIYPEPGLLQVNGSHLRLIIGYNDKKREILYTDSWGAGHELKRMPADWAWTISRCLMYMKPLAR